MRTLLSASALLSGAALADAHSGMFPEVSVEDGQAYLATTLMGTRIHVAEAELSPGEVLPEGGAAEFDDIGEIGDVVISADGALEAVIVDVGGFLGLGEREVAVAWDAIVPVVEEDDPSDVILVVNASRETLESAPEFDRGSDQAAMAEEGDDTVLLAEGTEVQEVEVLDADAADSAAELAENNAEIEAAEASAAAAADMADADLADTEAAEAAAAEELAEAGEAMEEAGEEVADAAEATGDAVAEGATEMADAAEEAMTDAEMEAVAETEGTIEEATLPDATRTVTLPQPAFTRDGYQEVGRDVLAAEDLEGMRVYGASDDDIGEVGEVLLSAGGAGVERVVLDIGGFLGLGEHQVAVTLDEIQVLRTEGDTRVYIDATQEQLEALPEYEG